MNRRKAIFYISLTGIGAAAGFSGYKWHSLNKAPDLKFLDHQKNLLNDLAELIIPETDTPGAGKAGVGEFIVKMVRDCTEVRSQNKFIEGLKDLSSYAEKKYKLPFISLNIQEKTIILQRFEKSGKPYSGLVGKIQRRYLGESFFTTLKRLTVEGYCTSQQGATQGLSYSYIPGNFIGCIPLQPGQKSWAI